MYLCTDVTFHLLSVVAGVRAIAEVCGWVQMHAYAQMSAGDCGRAARACE